MAHVPARERREQLIRATSRVISREGVAAATVRRIAEEAGTAPATVHYTFANKEDLFVQVLSSSLETTTESLNDGADFSGAGLAAAVERVIRAFLDPGRMDGEGTYAQFELLLWSLRSDVAPHAAPQLYTGIARGTVEAFERAAAPDEAGADLNLLAKLTTIFIDGALFGTLCNGDDYVAPADFTDIAQGLVAIVLGKRSSAASEAESQSSVQSSSKRERAARRG